MCWKVHRINPWGKGCYFRSFFIVNIFHCTCWGPELAASKQGRLPGLVLTLMKVIGPPSLKFKTKPPITPFYPAKPQATASVLAGDASISCFLLFEGSPSTSHGSENWLPLRGRAAHRKRAREQAALASRSGWIPRCCAPAENSGRGVHQKLKRGQMKTRHKQDPREGPRVLVMVVLDEMACIEIIRHVYTQRWALGEQPGPMPGHKTR